MLRGREASLIYVRQHWGGHDGFDWKENLIKGKSSDVA